MSNTSITNVEITDTFEIWIRKTNEVIDIINENVMLAGPGAGYIVEGNHELVGNFKATNISAISPGSIASLNSIITREITRADDITLPIDFFSPIKVTSNQENLLTLQTTIGSRPILRLINGLNSSWEVGQSTSAANSPITIRVEGSANPQLTLTQTGNLTVSGTITTGPGSIFTGDLTGNVIGNLTGNVTGNVTGNLTGNVTGNVTGNLTGDSNGVHRGNVVGNVTGNVAGNVIGNVTGTVSSIANHTTNALAEGGNNQYFTLERARTAISGTGSINYNPTTGVISATATSAGDIRAALSQGTGVTYNATTGVISIGQAVATNSNVTFAGITVNGGIAMTGGISGTSVSINGSITANGDITAFANQSDIRKKENIARIDNALDKVMQIGGYTYNFKGDDRKITGVIAQEMEKVLPEVVYDIDDEEYGTSKSVRYGNIVGLLIEAIKELKSEIDELKGR